MKLVNTSVFHQREHESHLFTISHTSIDRMVCLAICFRRVDPRVSARTKAVLVEVQLWERLKSSKISHAFGVLQVLSQRGASCAKPNEVLVHKPQTEIQVTIGTSPKEQTTLLTSRKERLTMRPLHAHQVDVTSNQTSLNTPCCTLHLHTAS